MYEKHLDLLNLVYDMQASIHGVTYLQIQEKYQVSRRTAERMIHAISNSFFEIELLSKRPKRWRLSRTMATPPLNIEQVSVLQSAAKMFGEHSMTTHAEQTHMLLRQLRANMDERALQNVEVDMDTLGKSDGFVAKPGPREKIDEKMLEQLRNAVLACEVISFDYISRKNQTQSRRTVEPYGFLSGTRRYLIGIDQYASDSDYKMFVLTRISNLNVHDRTYFKRDENFSIADLLKDSFGIYREKPSQVVWRFDKSVADEVREWKFHHSQSMRTMRDGRVEVKFYAGGIDEMVWHLVTWGDKVQVKQPQRLVKRLAQMRNAIRVPE